jgi:hypothetical protein
MAHTKYKVFYGRYRSKSNGVKFFMKAEGIFILFITWDISLKCRVIRLFEFPALDNGIVWTARRGTSDAIVAINATLVCL